MKRVVVIGLTVVALSAVGFTPAIGTTPRRTGQIVVRSVDAHGKLDKTFDRLIVCPVDPKRPNTVNRSLTRTSVGRCAPLKNGVATLKSVKRGSWIVRSYLAVGPGPCFNKVGSRGLHRRCTRIVVKAGKRAKVRWRIPMFG